MISKELEKSLLYSAASLYGAEFKTIRLCEQSDNYFYYLTINHDEYVLRVVCKSEAYEQIVSEVEWVSYLANHGATVAKAICSINNQLVEQIDVDGVSFLITVFQMAPGKKVDIYNTNEWNESLFRKWGCLMGKIHALAKGYVPYNNNYLRKNWIDTIEVNINNGNKKNLNIAEQKLDDCLKQIKELACDGDCFGLIHTDFNQENFYIYEGNITLFDFYDCAYGWFAMDIANSFYYALGVIHPCEIQKRNDFAKIFLCNFMEGYCMENSINAEMIKQIYLFLRFSQVFLYNTWYKYWDENNLTDWQQLYKNSVENDIACIDIDFFNSIFYGKEYNKLEGDYNL